MMNFGAQMGHMMQNMMKSQFQNHPLFRQAQQMAQGKSEEQIKQTCINLCRQGGIDLDAAWNQFQSQFPGMK